MKRFLGLALLLALMAVCMAVPASATRSLQKGDSTPMLDILDKLDRDPAAAIERNCAKLGHNPAQIGFDEATCTEPGYYVLECTRCHKEWKEKAKDKLGHNYQYAQTNPALCESNGKEWYECTRCGDTQYQTIPKLGHDYRVTSTVDATCTKDGKKIYTCSRLGCGAQKSETIAAKGNHQWEY
ncbi:MAG: hypothetical protein IJ337_09135, partial [Clostridia bacterium]|nr:hypothetical protein [Clostridia bacterium]